ncbi:MAG: hypothetical protein ACI91F_003712, partial [Candidatus Binatia bacterium]
MEHETQFELASASPSAPTELFAHRSQFYPQVGMLRSVRGDSSNLDDVRNTKSPASYADGAFCMEHETRFEL